jgi:glycine C-acetyltransferase
MDGTVANLPAICALADKYDAIVIVDDSHGTGVIGAGLRGTHEFHGCMGRVDILTGTLGKALGGGSGGYTSGKRTVIDLLRQASRTYLFSNSLSPVIAATSCCILDLLSSPKEGGRLREKLYKNTALFREGLAELGYDTGRAPAFAPGHPIVPVMCGDEAEARRLADGLYARNIYAVGFWFPVVPKGKARVRCQVSAAHTQGQLERALQAFAELK